MEVALDWSASVDLEDDLWVFDAGGDGSANLIIDFRKEQSSITASLYDDQNGDGEVSYEIGDRQPHVIESSHATARVTAPDGWWMRGDRVNFNLDVEVDGPVAAMVSYTRFLDQLETDGSTDFFIRIRDMDNSGRPDYDFRWSKAPLPSSWGLYRVHLMVSEQEHPLTTQDALFWPYLGRTHGPIWYTAAGNLVLMPLQDAHGHRYGFVQDYNHWVPPLQVDWSASRLVLVAEFVASRGGDHNWFVYSIPPFRGGEIYNGDFENPFAFYDLAGDSDGVPELLVRIERYPAADPHSPVSNGSLPASSVRYSWDQDNNGTWDYTLNLRGISEFGLDTVVVDGLSFITMPYGDVPDLVLGESWDGITFVASTEGGFTGMEGIYGWSLPSLVRDEYFTGSLDSVPTMDQLLPAQEFQLGFRADIALEPGLRPMLYLSAVDRNLHLIRAQFGKWTSADGRAEVHYVNLDRDDFLDQWIYFEEEERQSELLWYGNHVIYGDSGAFQIGLVEGSPAVFETLPPRNQRQWSVLSQQLSEHRVAFAPYDLAAMMSQFDGPMTSIQGATFDDFRVTKSGFRLALNLRPGFRVLEDSVQVGVGELQAGLYLVTFDGGFSILPLTVPRIEMMPGEIACDPSTPVLGEWTTVRITIHNAGRRDVQSLPVRVYAAIEGARPELLIDEELFVPGEGKQTIVDEWWPPAAGEWRIWIDVDPDGGAGQPQPVQVEALPGLDVTVKPAEMPNLVDLAGPYDGVRMTWPVLGLLASVAIIAVAVCRIALGPGEAGGVD